MTPHQKIRPTNFSRILLLLLSFLCVGNSFAQIKKIGTPFITNYQKNNYKGGTQSWEIAQQSNGMLYFANNLGVLQFDGTFWDLYTVPNNSVVRSIAIDSLDNIYVGASGEFGILKPNKFGKLSYHSLSKELTKESQHFSDIWKIYATKQGVYFQSYTALFLYKDNQLNTLLLNEDLDFSFYVNDTLFVRNRKTNNLNVK